jgi:hypothetical protein
MSAINLPIDAITVDTRAQSRAEIDMGLVAEYAELMRDGVIFPPLTVLHDGSTHWLSEGFHRIAAYREAAFLTVPCIVKTGGLREAILLSVGSNADHGKRRSNADKRRSVELLLKDQDWRSWSDREIAKQCAVTHPFVAEIRKNLSGNDYQIPASTETVRTATRNGTTYKVRTGNIGAKVKTEAEIEAAERRKVIKEADAFIAEMELKEKNVCELIDAHNIPAEYHAALIEAARGWAANSDASNREGTSVAVKGVAWWDEKSGNRAKRLSEMAHKSKQEAMLKKFGEYPFETTVFNFAERLRETNSASLADLLRCVEHFDSLSRERRERLQKILAGIRQKHIAGMDELDAKLNDLAKAVERDITPVHTALPAP